jgi:hypothetical protein
LTQAIDARLRLEFIGVDPSLIEASAQALGTELRRVEVVAVHRAAPATLARAVKAFPTAEVQGGTFGDFVHLNRDGLGRDATRAVFALCPTVHARDDRSLVETLEALPGVLAQARAMVGSCALDVGPCSLRRRLMPRTATPDVPDDAGRARDVDPRQSRSIAAAWLVGVIAQCATEDVATVCAFEAAGARGLVDGGAGQGFRTRAFAAFAALTRSAGEPLSLLALDARHGAAFTVGREPASLWLVDLSGERRALPPLSEAPSVLSSGVRGSGWTRAGAADTHRDVLPAYGIARFAQATGVDREVARRWALGSDA